MKIITKKTTSYHFPEGTGSLLGFRARDNFTPSICRMLSLGHCRFRHFLRHRALVQNKTLRIVTEHYTSQACPRCLKRNKLLGASKMFRCPFCKYQ